MQIEFTNWKNSQKFIIIIVKWKKIFNYVSILVVKNFGCIIIKQLEKENGVVLIGILKKLH